MVGRLTLGSDLAALRSAFEAAAEPSNVEPMRAYMKGQFDFFGLKTPERRAITKPLVGEAKKSDADLLLAFAEACWRESEREFHYAGADCLRAGAKHLRSSDLRRVRALIQEHSWWDTIDGLAAWVVGPMVAADSELSFVMDDWIDDPDMWVARTAILHQLSFKQSTDGERLFRYCDARASDTEFFIRKALGWALRQYARFEPEAVALYVAENDDVLSGLTKREALKHIGSTS